MAGYNPRAVRCSLYGLKRFRIFHSSRRFHIHRPFLENRQNGVVPFVKFSQGEKSLFARLRRRNIICDLYSYFISFHKLKFSFASNKDFERKARAATPAQQRRAEPINKQLAFEMFHQYGISICSRFSDVRGSLSNNDGDGYENVI